MATPILEMEGTWEELAAHATEFAGFRLRLIVLPVQTTETGSAHASKRSPSARELLRMPSETRKRILTAQAAKAESVYRSDPELTAFGAFGEEDFFDETP